MASTLNRYLAREVLLSWLAVTLVLLFILLSNQFARVLGDAAAGKLPRDAVMAIIGLTSVSYLTVLVPVSLFLAVMLALGRLYRDSEMSAIAACGVGPLRIYRPIGVVAFILALLLGWLSLYASPWAVAQAEIITESARQKAGLGALEPGRFRTSGAAGIVFYAESVDDQGMLRNVFLQRRLGERVEVAVAQSGEIVNGNNGGERTIVLRDGHRYEGTPGTVAFRIIHFGEHGIPIIATAAGASGSGDREGRPTASLLKSSALADRAEFQWRLSAPVSAMLLSLLAVPLARTNPRQGRYGKLAIGIGAYIVYANLLGAAQVWIEQGQVPPLVGMWPVHAVVAFLAATLLWRQHHLRAPA
ncbi:MAG: LPS export ABC transporter permease LptF [Gammaproteobacteria bacterium]|nr:LPS export ABC transporter permease LptF [Gammaproteobacteria bacterium]NND60919.1 LPS export ABC transporter permease LptF [Gammaproteobacteria bacterium]